MKKSAFLAATALLAALQATAEAATSDNTLDLLKSLCSQKKNADAKECKSLNPVSARTPPPSLPAPSSPTQRGRPELPTISWELRGSLPTTCVPASKALFVRSDLTDNFNYSDTLKNPAPGGSNAAGSADSGSSASGDTQGSTQSTNAKSKGLSIAYTDNMQAATQTAVINGRVSYLAFGVNECSIGAPQWLNSDGTIGHDLNAPQIETLGIAPFVSSNGTWNEPITTTTTSTTTTGKKSAGGTTVTTTSSGVTTTTVIQNTNGTITTVTKKESLSALRAGVDFQLGLSTLSLSTPDSSVGLLETYFYASPYYQTDYRGLAQIDGVDLSMEPVLKPLLNWLYIDNEPGHDAYFSYMTQFKAEAELTHVYDTGLTQLSRGQHAWIGELARPNLSLFPALPDEPSENPFIDKWIRGRISLIGTQKFYWDAYTGKTAAYYSALLQYKLGECKTATTKALAGAPCAVSGSSSISFEYDWGRDKDTNVKSNQILVKLGYSY